MGGGWAWWPQRSVVGGMRAHWQGLRRPAVHACAAMHGRSEAGCSHKQGWALRGPAEGKAWRCSPPDVHLLAIVVYAGAPQAAGAIPAHAPAGFAARGCERCASNGMSRSGAPRNFLGTPAPDSATVVSNRPIKLSGLKPPRCLSSGAAMPCRGPSQPFAHRHGPRYRRLDEGDMQANTFYGLT